MHCSHCGFENPANHRYCGMCGTPLSQRPVAPPAAHSTLSFVSSTLEVARKASSTLSSHIASGPAAIEEAPMSPPSAPANSDARAEQAGEAEPSNLPPADNYFTKAQEAESLEQFIAGFQYTPPAEVEEEVDMAGEKPVLDSSGDNQPPAPAGLSEEPPPVSALPVGVEQPVPAEAAPVESFSLEVPPPFATKSLRAKPAEPPRVLDLSVPPAKDAAGEGAPHVERLSLLGLDAPPPVSPTKADDVAPRRSRWVLWVAVIVILSVAALGFLEWRAETYQINYGPVGILKTQIQRLRAWQNTVVPPAPSTGAAPGTAPANSTPQPNSSGPEMQTAPSPNPQSSNSGNTPEAPANKPATNSPSAPVTH